MILKGTGDCIIPGMNKQSLREIALFLQVKQYYPSQYTSHGILTFFKLSPPPDPHVLLMLRYPPLRDIEFLKINLEYDGQGYLYLKAGIRRAEYKTDEQAGENQLYDSDLSRRHGEPPHCLGVKNNCGGELEACHESSAGWAEEGSLLSPASTLRNTNKYCSPG